jgi:predicted RNA-binding protein with RPS1 domain
MGKTNPTNDFVEAFLSNGKIETYKAFVKLPNGDTGVSPEYSKEVLEDYLKETKQEYVKVLKIVKI